MPVRIARCICIHLTGKCCIIVLCVLVACFLGIIIPQFMTEPLDEAEEYFLAHQRAEVPSNLQLAVTTLVLNQGGYLREWIEFHIMMGFEFFIIFDHGSTDDTLIVLSKFILSGRVMFIDAETSFEVCKQGSIARKHHTKHPHSACQGKVFNFAKEILKGKTKWMGNFDVDEFLWVPQAYQEIVQPTVFQVLETDFRHFSYVQVVGSVFGTNGVQHPVFDNTVIETYTRRAKIIPGISDSGGRFGRKALYRPEYMSYVTVHGAFCVLCWWTIVQPLSWQIRMNHYQFKSREEQKQKQIVNGNNAIQYNPSTEGFWNVVYDTEILYLLPELKLRLNNTA